MERHLTVVRVEPVEHAAGIPMPEIEGTVVVVEPRQFHFLLRATDGPEIITGFFELLGWKADGAVNGRLVHVRPELWDFVHERLKRISSKAATWWKTKGPIGTKVGLMNVYSCRVQAGAFASGSADASTVQ